MRTHLRRKQGCAEAGHPLRGRAPSWASPGPVTNLPSLWFRPPYYPLDPHLTFSPLRAAAPGVWTSSCPAAPWRPRREPP